MSAGELPPVAMSVDVEDWFQVENLKSAIPRSSWESYHLRVDANTRRILDIFDETGTRATFFTLGWVAERLPGLVRDIAVRGHEVASHGYGHELLYDIGPDRFRDDIRRAKGLLQDTSGQEVIGYRAPSFTITGWALEILREEGYRYDSSYFPASGHDRYSQLSEELFPRPAHGRAGSRSFKQELSGGITELSIPVLELLGKRIPWGGGGYFRLYPPRLFRAGFAAAARRNGGALLYLHPWELDPEQPRVDGLPAGYAFRHYVNLGKTADRLRALCQAFRFRSCREIVEAEA
jgi:polysaccharide deacetylase family protein (PEP-CTERM system associated)